MRVLWVCNIMLPAIAEALHREASNKEGWLSGLLSQVAAENDGNIELAVAFPASMDRAEEIPWKFHVNLPGTNADTSETATLCDGDGAENSRNITCYPFHEDTVHPDQYQPALEPEFRKITEDFVPDVVHCFGTEYPHTLAICRVYPRKERILLGIQGICTLCAEAYFADMPEPEIGKATFRDLVKRDTLRSQRQKFARRGIMEREAIGLAGNITGRTDWDRGVTTGWNSGAQYYTMNETLRGTFYEGAWAPENCEPHSIFVSQGDYPLKGLHYLLKALPQIRESFPDVQVYVAGNDLTAYRTWKQKLKISAYGKYLRSILKEGGIDDRVHFLGRLTAEEMKSRFLMSNLFLCCSSLENSPNSLGEAMLLGVPCVSTEVGGIPSMFAGGKDGLWCMGHQLREDPEADGKSRNNAADDKKSENNKNNMRNNKRGQTAELENIVNSMAESIIKMWSDPKKMMEYSKNARKHARKTHDKRRNFEKMQEIYAEIAGREG